MFEHHGIALPDVHLHYVTAGDGPPLVLLHGWPQSWYEWRGVMPELARHYGVIAPDLRGLGDSGKPAGGYDKMTIAADIAALLDSLGHDRIRLVGHDWGAGVAYAFAARYPLRVSHLAILEMVLPGIPLPGVSDNALGQYWHMGFHGVRDLPEALVQGRERLYISWFFRNFASNPAAIPPADVDEYARCVTIPGALRAGFEYYRAIAQDAADFAAAAKTPLTMPVLALGGDASIGDLVKLSMEQVADQVTGGSLPGCGHWIPEEQPRGLLDRLLPFLDQTKAT